MTSSAKDRCDNKVYKEATRKIRRRKTNSDDGVSEDADAIEKLSPSDNSRINTFYAVIDKLHMALNQSITMHETMATRFVFLSEALSAAYLSDMQSDFRAEFKQFTCFADSQLALLSTENHKAAENTLPQQIYTLLKSSDVEGAFPNVEVSLRIYLSLIVTNCTSRRSFSQLKRIKSELRSTMFQSRLSH